jgi:hypothetical protein
MDCAPLRLLQFDSDECEIDEELICPPLRLVIMVGSDWGETLMSWLAYTEDAGYSGGKGLVMVQPDGG